MEFCTSCGVGLQEKGATTFRCPGCGEETISRCDNCREMSVPYQCAKCGFRGP